MAKKKPEDEDYASARCTLNLLHLHPSSFIQLGLHSTDASPDILSGIVLCLTDTVFRPHQKIPSDVYAIDDARREQTGFIMAEKPTRREPRHEAATDEQVYERFKKR